MSKGPGRIQQTVLAILRGQERTRVYSNGVELTTAELLDELEERELVDCRRPRKQKMAAVFRSCVGLVNRGLVSGRYIADMDNAGRTTVSWQATVGHAPGRRPAVGRPSDRSL